MPDDDVCAHGDHRPPAAGGACPCGMVTRIPVPRPVTSEEPALRDLIAAVTAAGFVVTSRQVATERRPA